MYKYRHIYIYIRILTMTAQLRHRQAGFIYGIWRRDRISGTETGIILGYVHAYVYVQTINTTWMHDILNWKHVRELSV